MPFRGNLRNRLFAGSYRPKWSSLDSRAHSLDPATTAHQDFLNTQDRLDISRVRLRSMPGNETVGSGIRRVANGPAGRRVVWLLLVFMVGFFVVGSYRHWLPAELVGLYSRPWPPQLASFAKELLQVFVVLTATLVIRLYQARQLGSLRSADSQKMFGKEFWLGAGWGFVMLSVTIGPDGCDTFVHTGFKSCFQVWRSSNTEYCGRLLFCSLVGVAEELAFRGYLQYTLTIRMGFWPASIVTCFFFAFAHRNNSGENWIGLGNIAVIGVFACLTASRTGSLWFAIGWHMAFDWEVRFFPAPFPTAARYRQWHLFNTSFSGSSWLTGGTVGPEASVFNVFATVIGTALFAFVYPEARCRQPSNGGRS